MFVLYSLAMRSIWYIRPRDRGEGERFAALDFDSKHSDVAG